MFTFENIIYVIIYGEILLKFYLISTTALFYYQHSLSKNASKKKNNSMYSETFKKCLRIRSLFLKLINGSVPHRLYIVIS